MSKIYVVAGTTAQAEQWIRKDLERRAESGITTLSRSEYVVVSSPLKLMGIANPHGVFVGTWADRIDILSIVETLINHSTDSARLRQIHHELWQKSTNGQITSLAALNIAKQIDQEIINELSSMRTTS